MRRTCSVKCRVSSVKCHGRGRAANSTLDTRHSTLRIAAIAAFAAFAAGCATVGGSAARQVNAAALAPRISYTDDVSRLLAQRSLELLKQRTEDYRVGPEDVLEISIFEWELREETKTSEFRVSEGGVIALPIIGELKVGGKTVEEIKKQIETSLKEGQVLKDPRVAVTIKEFRSKRVAVVGAVSDPGVYTLRQNVTTLLDVLSLAGGVNERAGYVLYVVRTQATGSAGVAPAPEAGTMPALRPDAGPQTNVITIDLFELLENGNLALNVVLTNGDVVNVPEAKKFSVVGYVREPGSFPLKKPTTVLEGIAMARGLQEREASPADCILKRYTATGEEIIPLNLEAISAGRRPNLYLMANDVIDVRQTLVRKVGLEVLDFVKSVFNVGYTLNR